MIPAQKEMKRKDKEGNADLSSGGKQEGTAGVAKSVDTCREAFPTYAREGRIFLNEFPN